MYPYQHISFFSSLHHPPTLPRDLVYLLTQSNHPNSPPLFLAKTYLVVHNHLLESRSNHSFLSGLLATAPNTFSVGRLHDSALLSLGNRLLQWLVHVAFAAQGHGIGAADGRGCRTVLGVVGWDGVVGAADERGAGEGAGDGGVGAAAAA